MKCEKKEYIYIYDKYYIYIYMCVKKMSAIEGRAGWTTFVKLTRSTEPETLINSGTSRTAQLQNVIQ